MLSGGGSDHAITIITHGFELPWTWSFPAHNYNLPDWVTSMASCIQASPGVQASLGPATTPVIPVPYTDDGTPMPTWNGNHDFLVLNWAGQSNDGTGLYLHIAKHDGRVTRAAKIISDLVENEIKAQPASGNGLGDKYDLNFIGHSFGTLVNQQALDNLYRSDVADRIDFVMTTALDPVGLRDSTQDPGLISEIRNGNNASYSEMLYQDKAIIGPFLSGVNQGIGNDIGVAALGPAYLLVNALGLGGESIGDGDLIHKKEPTSSPVVHGLNGDTSKEDVTTEAEKLQDADELTTRWTPFLHQYVVDVYRKAQDWQEFWQKRDQLELRDLAASLASTIHVTIGQSGTGQAIGNTDANFGVTTYALIAQRAGSLNVDIVGLTGGFEGVATLRSLSSGRVSAASVGSGLAHGIRVSLDKVSAGERFSLDVNAAGSSPGSYEVRVTQPTEERTDPTMASAPPRVFHDAAGQDVSGAKVVNLDGRNKGDDLGRIQPADDVDFYKFKANATGKVQVDVLPQGGLTTSATVYGGDIVGGDGVDHFLLNVVQGEWYYIKIKSANGSMGLYELHIYPYDAATAPGNSGTDGAPGPLLAWPDVRGVTIKLRADGSGNSQGTNNDPGQVDWFEIDGAQAGVMQVQVTSDANSVVSFITAFRADHSGIDTDQAKSNGRGQNIAILRFNVTAGETIFVSVTSADGGAMGHYELAVSKSAIAPGDDAPDYGQQPFNLGQIDPLFGDEYVTDEGNGYFTAAIQARPAGQPADNDWVEIPVRGSGEMVVEVDASESALQPWLDLNHTGGDGGWFADSESRQNDSRFVFLPAPVTTSIWAKISGLNGTQGAYTLNIWRTADPKDDYPDSGGIGTHDRALGADGSLTLPGNIGGPGDIDSFRVRTGAGPVAIEVIPLTPGLVLKMHRHRQAPDPKDNEGTDAGSGPGGRTFEIIPDMEAAPNDWLDIDISADATSTRPFGNYILRVWKLGSPNDRDPNSVGVEASPILLNGSGNGNLPSADGKDNANQPTPAIDYPGDVDVFQVTAAASRELTINVAGTGQAPGNWQNSTSGHATATVDATGGVTLSADGRNAPDNGNTASALLAPAVSSGVSFDMTGAFSGTYVYGRAILDDGAGHSIHVQMHRDWPETTNMLVIEASGYTELQNNAPYDTTTVTFNSGTPYHFAIAQNGSDIDVTMNGTILARFAGIIAAGSHFSALAHAAAAPDRTAQLSVSNVMVDGQVGFNTFITVYDANGTPVETDENSGPGGSSQVTLDANRGDLYYIKVAAFDSSKTGGYLVTVSQPTGDPNDQPDTPIFAGFDSRLNHLPDGAKIDLPPSGDRSASGQINPVGDRDVFTVTAPSRGVMTVDVVGKNDPSGNPPTLDSVVRVYDSRGNLVAIDDDSGGNRNAHVSFSTFMGEQYQVEVSGYGDDSVGYYKVLVHESGPNSVEQLGTFDDFNNGFDSSKWSVHNVNDPFATIAPANGALTLVANGDGAPDDNTSSQINMRGSVEDQVSFDMMGSFGASYNYGWVGIDDGAGHWINVRMNRSANEATNLIVVEASGYTELENLAQYDTTTTTFTEGTAYHVSIQNEGGEVHVYFNGALLARYAGSIVSGSYVTAAAHAAASPDRYAHLTIDNVQGRFQLNESVRSGYDQLSSSMLDSAKWQRNGTVTVADGAIKLPLFLSGQAVGGYVSTNGTSDGTDLRGFRVGTSRTADPKQLGSGNGNINEVARMRLTNGPDYVEVGWDLPNNMFQIQLHGAYAAHPQDIQGINVRQSGDKWIADIQIPADQVADGPVEVREWNGNIEVLHNDQVQLTILHQTVCAGSFFTFEANGDPTTPSPPQDFSVQISEVQFYHDRPPIAPTGTPAMLAASDTGPSNSDEITNQTSVGFQWPAGDAGIQYQWRQGVLQPDGTAAYGTWSVPQTTATATAAVPSAGTYLFDVRPIDATGIVGPESARGFVVDTSAPVASAGAAYMVLAGGTLTLDASGTSDPNEPNDGLTYAWDLDGDGVFGETGEAAAQGDETGLAPTFSAAGLTGGTVVTVRLRATDAAGNVSNIVTATLTVDQAAAITTPDQATFTVGTLGRFSVMATGFPPPPLSESGALPSGVTFDATSGVLTGTPGAGVAGVYPITFTAHNGIGLDATQSFTLTVANALEPNAQYVGAAFEDVLGRSPDQSGLAYWTQQLDQAAPRSTVAALIDHSAEYFGNIIITPAYLRFLGRAPDAAGLAYWVDQMQHHGLTDERLEAGFIGSAEFYEHAGGTDKAWVDAMYVDLLGRFPDAAGETYWVSKLSNGAQPSDVAYGFAASLERERQRITDDYMHYLGRLPDEQGLDYWVQQFADGVTNEDVITGFVASDEYFARHTS